MIGFYASPLGDRAFLLRWHGEIEAGELAAKAIAIENRSLPWLLETVTASRSIAIYMKATSPMAMSDAIREVIPMAGRQFVGEVSDLPPREVELPVVYGGEHGPDLADCAIRSEMTAEQFAAKHSEVVYTVDAMGFAPGFPYLSGLPDGLTQPRHASPRLKVPAGSVGIAGDRTGIYPTDSPGGWQIIGRTAVPLFRPNHERPFLLSQGDRVKFVPVAEYSSIPAEAAAGDASRDRERPANAALTVLKPGLHTTIQDSGRIGWRSSGVSPGGAMDGAAMRMANLLVGNDEYAAVLELTLIGGHYICDNDVLIAICGADLSPCAGGDPIPMNRPVYLARGAELSFGAVRSGCRAYVAVAGGIDVPDTLGSKSTDTRAGFGGRFGRALAEGDAIGSRPFSPQSSALLERIRTSAIKHKATWGTVKWSAAPPVASGLWQHGSRSGTLRLVPGAEWDDFTPESRKALLKSSYRVEASSDRMGLRLSGEALSRNASEELSSHGVVPGTIQVPAGGQPIILGAGCQPTGGYPKIAHVITADWPMLAQAAPGDRLYFEMVDLETAERELANREKEFARLKAGIFAYTRALMNGEGES
ncbi:5-oxoprolinase subunit PxpB [Cohnella terricola]|nr:5-oxoprolinase subunit PxpB [Cohnella terricola]